MLEVLFDGLVRLLDELDGLDMLLVALVVLSAGCVTLFGVVLLGFVLLGVVLLGLVLELLLLVALFDGLVTFVLLGFVTF